MLTAVAEGEKVTTAEVIATLRISARAFDELSRSLGAEGLLVSVVPLGSPNLPARGWWEVTPRGLQVLGE